jgi:hypothetical protein
VTTPIEGARSGVALYLTVAIAVKKYVHRKVYREKTKQGAAQTRVLLNNKMASYMLP